MERQSNLDPEVSVIESQKRILEKLGLWSTPEYAQKYRYRLSPDVLAVNGAEKSQLEEITELIYSKGGFLDGSVKLYNKTASPQFTGTEVGGIVWRALTAGVGKKEIPLQGPDSNLPFISRLDLMRTQENDPSMPFFQIAEVEGDKTHGFGYLTIMDLFRAKFLGRNDTRGILWALNQELTKSGILPGTPVVLIVGMKERFYLPELNIFAGAAQNLGVNLVTTLEDKVKVNDDGLFVPTVEGPINCLVNIPGLTPNGYGQSGIDAEKLFELYKSGKIKCTIPPKRFLGSKGLLALVSNGDGNPQLEEVLNEVFDKSALSALRKFIPPTILIAKKNKNYVRSLLESDPNSWVVKQTMSSGMKGVALSVDNEKNVKFIEEALNTPFNYVVQKKVKQQTRLFKFAEPENPSLIKSANMYMRIELFASSFGIATVGVTARETPSVHGAKDAIQIPIIYEG